MLVIVQPYLADIGGALLKGPGAGPSGGVGGWIARVPERKFEHIYRFT